MIKVIIVTTFVLSKFPSRIQDFSYLVLTPSYKFNDYEKKNN